MQFGIESIEMYVPGYVLELQNLATARGVDPGKYLQGIGQEKMAVPPPDEDVVTMGANAAALALEGIDTSSIRSVIFATESGIDQSKAAAIYVHRLLGLPANCRTVEMKQACCSSTSALHFALATVALKPDQKVLVIASDVARYGLGSTGEPTQGAGAVAMVISAQPKVMALDADVGYYTEDVMDFWRPNYLDEALVDGKYSIKVYLHALEHCWKNYQEATGASFQAFDHFCYHLPFSRMGLKAHMHLARSQKVKSSPATLQAQLDPALGYNRLTGNAYTASLYISLLSLLDHASGDLTHQRVGFFSYGSGCMGAFFGGTLLPGCHNAEGAERRKRMLEGRQQLSVSDYEAFYQHALPMEGQAYRTDRHRTGHFRLAGVENHQRLYETVPVQVSAPASIPARAESENLKAV